MVRWIFKKNIQYSYVPETFIHLANEINSVFQSVLDLKTYAIITQGSNEFYDDSLLHISKSRNHISLNSLGLPFAQLMDIDNAVRKAIESKTHSPAELYLDKQYYYSLKFKFGFDKNGEPNNSYLSKMVETPCRYYFPKMSTILDNLKPSK